MKKRIFSFFLAFIMMFTFFVPYLVSAEETTEATKTAFTVEELLQMGFVSSINFSETDLINIYRLSRNETITDFDNTIIADVDVNARRYYINSKGNVEYMGVGVDFIFMQKYYVFSDDDYTYYTNFSNEFSIYPYNSIRSSNYISVDTDYTVAMKNVVDSDFIIVFRKSKSTYDCNYFICEYEFYKKNNYTSVSDVFQTSYFTDRVSSYTPYYYCINREDNSTSPDINLDPNIKLVPPSGIIVDVDIDSFAEWIIENKRYEDIAECGLDVAQDKIKYLVEWWSKYGTSPARMLLGLPKLIANINVIDVDISLISSVCNCIDNLYIEYKRYVDMMEGHKLQYDHAYWPGHLQEDDDGNKDYTYVTDTEEDDVYTSLLREILRAISSLPDLIATKLSYLQTYLDSILIDFNRLLNYITLLPDSFADSAYNVFIEPINLIIDALGNVGSSNNIEIEIPETKKDEVDLFFDEWHTNFSEKLNSKIPVFTQLSELFNDNFFEKCGLDVNDDGEVYQYFTAGSVSSSGSTSDEVEAVESLLLQFDKADTNFANIEYSGDIPDGWTVTIAGNDIEIFDFKVFARYRSKIHIIIVFVAYTAYLLSLFKSLPTIIGNVSDVQNAFTSHFEQSRNKEE